MKKYDLVIFGSTFFAAGLCASCKGSKLIIESKTKPGYEFIDAYHPGNMIDYSPITKGGKEFLAYSDNNGLSRDSYILRWTPYLAKKIISSDVTHLFLTDIIDVREDMDGYVITVFNTMGKSEIFAKKIIDTRTTDYKIKTINFLTKGDAPLSEDKDLKLIMQYEDYSIYERKLSIDDDYPSARKKAVESFTYLKSLSDKIYLVAIADEFFKKATDRETELTKNYFICPSAYYDNPIEAYDMGAEKGEKIQ